MNEFDHFSTKKHSANHGPGMSSVSSPICLTNNKENHFYTNQNFNESLLFTAQRYNGEGLNLIEHLKDNLFDSSSYSQQSINKLFDQENDYNMMGNANNYQNQNLLNDKRFSKDRYHNPLITDNGDDQISNRSTMFINNNNLFGPSPPLSQASNTRVNISISVNYNLQRNEYQQSVDKNNNVMSTKTNETKTSLTSAHKSNLEKEMVDNAAKYETNTTFSRNNKNIPSNKMSSTDITLQEKLNMANAKQMGSFQALLHFKQGLLVKKKENTQEENAIKQHCEGEKPEQFQSNKNSIVLTSKSDKIKQQIPMSVQSAIDQQQPSSQNSRGTDSNKSHPKIISYSQNQQKMHQPQSFVAKMKNNLSQRNQDNEILSELLSPHNGQGHNITQNASAYCSSNDSRNRKESDIVQRLQQPIDIFKNSNKENKIPTQKQITIQTDKMMKTQQISIQPLTAKNVSRNLLNNNQSILSQQNQNIDIANTQVEVDLITSRQGHTTSTAFPQKSATASNHIKITTAAASKKSESGNLRRRTTRQLFRSTSREKVDSQKRLSSTSNTLSLHTSLDKKQKSLKHLSSFQQTNITTKRTLSGLNTMSPQNIGLQKKLLLNSMNQSKSPQRISNRQDYLIKCDDLANFPGEFLDDVTSLFDQYSCKKQLMTPQQVNEMLKYLEIKQQDIKLITNIDLKKPLKIDAFKKLLMKISIIKYHNTLTTSSDRQLPFADLLCNSLSKLIEQYFQEMLQVNSQQQQVKDQDQEISDNNHYSLGRAQIKQMSSFDQILISQNGSYIQVMKQNEQSNDNNQQQARSILVIDEKMKELLKEALRKEIMHEDRRLSKNMSRHFSTNMAYNGGLNNNL